MEIGNFILDSRREEANGDRKQRAHNYSLDAIAYEGREYGREDKYPCMDESDEKARRVRMAFRCLTETQRRRLWLHAIGEMSFRKIARLEGVTAASVSESVKAGKRKFMQFYQKKL